MRQLLSGRPARGRIIRTVSLVSVLCAVAALSATPAFAHPSHQFSPQVLHTGRAPTGYEVTFRYYDPSATTVQVRGEWFFSNAANTTTTSSLGLLPTQWSPGDFPIAFPNQGPAPNWPVAQMTLDHATGVWSYTTPLPSGTFTYGFYVNCRVTARCSTCPIRTRSRPSRGLTPTGGLSPARL